MQSMNSLLKLYKTNQNGAAAIIISLYNTWDD